MDYDLPKFEPVALPSVVSDVQVLRDRQLRPENIDIARAEALCHAGDASAATAEITQLLRAGTNVQTLQHCLLAAVLAGSQNLVRTLLDAGVPVRLVNVKAAIDQKSPRILGLFLQHGWNINESEEWCLPPLLSCVTCQSYV